MISMVAPKVITTSWLQHAAFAAEIIDSCDPEINFKEEQGIVLCEPK